MMKQAARFLAGVGVALTIGCDRIVTTACESGDPAMVPVAAGAPRLWSSPPATVELWRAGGSRETEPLALPAALAVSPGGYAAVPDFQLAAVSVIGPDGSWLGSWSRPGSGPGEVRVPIAAVWGPDESLLVWDIEGSKVVRIHRQTGEDISVSPAFSYAVVASGQVLWAAIQANGTVATKRRENLPGPNRDSPVHTETLLVLPPGAGAPDTVARSEVRMLAAPYHNFFAPGEAGLVAALSSSGRLAIAEKGSSYRVRVHLPERGILICRDRAPDPVSPEERGDIVATDDEDLARALQEAQPAASPDPISRMFFDAEERLWIQHDRASATDSWGVLYGSAGGRYDVFSPGGDYLGEVHAPDGARLQSALGDTLWALEIGPFDEPWVVAYRMVLP